MPALESGFGEAEANVQMALTMCANELVSVLIDDACIWDDDVVRDVSMCFDAGETEDGASDDGNEASQCLPDSLLDDMEQVSSTGFEMEAQVPYEEVLDNKIQQSSTVCNERMSASEQEQPPFHMRPSVGSWFQISIAGALPKNGMQCSMQQQARTSVHSECEKIPLPPFDKLLLLKVDHLAEPTMQKRPRRKIIGGMVRAVHKDQEVSELIDSATTFAPAPLDLARIQQPTTAWVGSPAVNLRRQVSKRNHGFVSYRMDVDDTSSLEPHKSSGLSRVGSSSSITNAYNALGVEFHCLDEKDSELATAPGRAAFVGGVESLPFLRPRAQHTAMELDLGGASWKMPQPHSGAKKSALLPLVGAAEPSAASPGSEAQRPQSRGRAALALAAPLELISSVGTLHCTKSVQLPGSLPMVPAKPKAPAKTSSIAGRRARRWVASTPLIS